MNIEAILFDKDGTLADFEATFNPVIGKVIENLGASDHGLMEKIADVLAYDLVEGKVADHSIVIAGSGYDVAQALQPVLKIQDLNAFAFQIDELCGDFCLETITGIPGVESVLQDLHDQQYQLAVATNDAEKNARSQMQALSVDHLFTAIIGADSGHGPKPGPGMINAFVAEHGFEPQQVLMVGDSLHDLEAGRAAGVRTCGVETGPANRSELQPFADVVLGSVVDLPQWLGRSMQ
ncbi:MAG: HAD family hydrolase [Pseudomonadota bacterium]